MVWAVVRHWNIIVIVKIHTTVKGHRNDVTAAATAVTAAATPVTTTIEKEIQQISLQRPTYITRRMAGMLTRFDQMITYYFWIGGKRVGNIIQTKIWLQLG